IVRTAASERETECGLAEQTKSAHGSWSSQPASSNDKHQCPSQNSHKVRHISWPRRGGPHQLHAQTKRCRQRGANQQCGRCYRWGPTSCRSTNYNQQGSIIVPSYTIRRLRRFGIGLFYFWSSTLPFLRLTSPPFYSERIALEKRASRNRWK
uniref:Cyclic nucleotide-binding domain-containing protein n=1 Tax=Parascaris univalens TaxID=6257 RepID=A0A915B3B6_PARUN